MNSPEKIIPWVIILMMISTSVCGFHGSAENDTIRPQITNLPIDLITRCNGDYISELSDWLEIDGGALASDNSGVVSIETTLDLQTIQDSLSDSFGSFCDPNNNFEIGFYAIDTCGNTSLDTSFVRFLITDNDRPVIEVAASNATVQCDNAAQDSLDRWVRSIGGAIASDECSPSIEWYQFFWVDNLDNASDGNPTDGPFIPIDRQSCNWSVTVSFLVRDLCGNIEVTEAVFSLTDTIAPTFLNPQASMTIACNQITDGIEVEDNCDPNLEATFVDISTTRSVDSTSCEFYNYSLERLWTVEDACGNTNTFNQSIMVVDTIIPSFNVPPDITIFCSTDIQPAITGFPTEVIDNCNPDPLVIFSDSGGDEGCGSVISRFWQIADGCGSSNIIPQQITLLDTIRPSIETPASDLTLSCEDPDSLTTMFDDWLENIGGAVAQDECASLDWFAAVPGSYDLNDSSTFPGDLINSVDDLACGSNEVMVDFVFIDECQNAAVTSASFLLIDSIAPVFDEPFEEIVIDVDTNCVREVMMIFPAVSDNCLADSQIVKQIIFEDRVVELQALSYDTLLPLGVYPFTYTISDCSGNSDSISSTITIRDSEAPVVKCPQDFETELDAGDCIAVVKLSADSIATDNCGEAIISYQVSQSTIIDLVEISNQEDSLSVSLNVGANLIEYVARDESGNESACSFTITVGDREFQDIECKDETILLSISDPNPFPLVDSLFIENLVDNCFIDSISIPPSERSLTCDQVGDRRGVVITIFDRAGNSQNCTSIVTVGVERFEASYENSFCANDTLKLFANVPLFGDIDQNVYSWSGPNNFISTEANPILSEVDSTFAGTYFVSVTGEAGCSQQDTVEVVIESFEVPQISSLDTISCSLDSLSLMATAYNFEVVYNWYGGIFPDGNLIDTSRNNEITFLPSGGIEDYYVIVENNECTSPPSNILKVQSQDIIAPVISCPSDTVITLSATSCVVDAILPSDFTASDNCGDGNISLNYLIEGNGLSIQDTLQIDQENMLTDLEIGVYNTTYIVTDNANNTDSCFFNFSVVDSLPPSLSCKNDSINLSINQLNNFTVEDLDILISASDNCELDTVMFAPYRIDCGIIGERVNITIMANDISGNSIACVSTVNVMLDSLQINFTNGICPGDTLQLSTNINDTTGLSFNWSGPNDFSSTEINPIIINPSVQNNGLYRLSVGSEGSCFIDSELEIEAVEIVTPTIASNKGSLCTGESLQLTTQNYGGNVTYSWYEGISPNGTLIAEETQPTHTLNPELGIRNFYVVVTNETCSSDPSPSIEISILDQPTLAVESNTISVCEGESFNLSIENPNEDLEYEWMGPNNYSSTDPDNSLVASENTQGSYTVFAKVGTCISDTLNVEVTLQTESVSPTLEGQQQYCPGSTLRLEVINITDATEYTWTLDNETYTTTTTNVLEVDNVSSDLSGNWEVSIVGSCGNGTSESINVDVISDLEIAATSNSPVCGMTTLQLEVNEIEGATYSWEGPDGFTSNERNPSLNAIAGTYTVTVSAGDECQSVSSTEVVRKNQPSISNIETNIETCESNITDLILTPSVGGNPDLSYEWTGPNGYTSSEPIAVVENFSSSDEGIYSLVVTQDGCRSQPSNIVVERSGMIAAPSISASSEVCIGSSFTVLAEVATDNIDEYVWTTPRGEQITSEPSLVVDDSDEGDSGNYSLILRSGDCISESSQSIEISIGSTASAPSILSQGQFCLGETIQLEADFRDGDYEWRGPNGFESTNANPVIFNVNEDFEGAYEVRVITSECTSPWSEPFTLSLVDIPITPTPEITEAALCLSDYRGDFQLCVDEASVIEGASYSWINEATGDTLGVSDERCFLLTTIDRLRPGRNNFNVVTSLGNCFSDVSSRVTLTLSNSGDSNLETNAGEDIFTCEDFVELSAQLATDERGTWSSVSDNVDFGDSSDPASTAMGLTQGENIFVWSIQGASCSSGVDSVSIFFGSAPSLVDDEFTFVSGQDPVIDPLANDALPASFNFEILSLEGVTGADASDPRAIKLSVEDGFSGDISVTYEVCNDECAEIESCSQATVRINIEGAVVCQATNLITPNGDGMNDRFVVPCLSSDAFPNNRVIIFNQWGDEVYSATPYTNDWQGTFNGEDLPVGTYFFILDLGTGQKPQDGFIQLER